MSFSNQLTELYQLLKRSNDSLDYIYTEDFSDYLGNLTVQQFVNSVFVYGFEVRDELTGSMDSEMLKLLELLAEKYNNVFKEQIEADDTLQSIYNIGITNIYLYFCKREDLATSENPLLGGDQAQAKILDINRSVDFLRQATKLASATLDISKGIYHYHVIRIFEYIFSIFEFYKVDNNDKPIDLDSFYVFSDQLNSSELWVELARQIKVKYKYETDKPE